MMVRRVHYGEMGKAPRTIIRWQLLKTFNFMETINSNRLNHLTACKQMSSGSFKNNVNNKLFPENHTCMCVCVSKQNLALNNPKCWYAIKHSQTKLVLGLLLYKLRECIMHAYLTTIQ